MDLITLCRQNKFNNILNVIKQNCESINVQDEKGLTALHWCASHNNKIILLRLLQHNANPNIKDRIGHTPLHIAIIHKHLTIVEALLMNDADPNILDSRSRNSLHLAVILQFKEAYQPLLKSGATIDQKIYEEVSANSKIDALKLWFNSSRISFNNVRKLKNKKRESTESKYVYSESKKEENSRINSVVTPKRFEIKSNIPHPPPLPSKTNSLKSKSITSEPIQKYSNSNSDVPAIEFLQELRSNKVFKNNAFIKNDRQNK